MSHPPHEPPFDLQRKGSGGGGRTRGDEEGTSASSCPGGDAGGTVNREGHPRPFLRKSPATGAQTTEPVHHNGKFMNDVRVSPIDEGVSVVEEDETVTCGTTTPDWSQRIFLLPRSRRTTRSRRRDSRNCGHSVPRGSPADLLLGALLGPLRVRRSVSRSVTA